MLPSRLGVGTKVMKNWLPFVPFPLLMPAFAIESVPAVSWRRSGLGSLLKVYPGPLVPVPVGSPPWAMKPAMTRWKVMPS